MPRYTKETLPGARTYAQVEYSVANNVPPSGSLPNPYLSCRYMPFSSKGAKSNIPDGRGLRILTRDWKSFYDFDSSGGGFTVRVAPIFPYPVRAYSRNPLTVNGTLLNATTLLENQGAILDAGAMSTGMTNPVTAHTLGVCTSARIVTIGYRLVYTGQASAAEGLFIADHTAIKVDKKIYEIPNIVSYVNSAGAVTNWPVSTVPFYMLDETPLSSVLNSRDQVTVRPENGVYGVLRYNTTSRAHTFKPWNEVPNALITDVVPASVGAPSQYASTVAGIGPAAVCIDDDLSSINIRVTQAGSYRLEVIVCMEQELQVTSNLIDMARQSPEWDESILKADDHLNAMVNPKAFNEPMFPRMEPRPQRVRQPKPKQQQKVVLVREVKQQPRAKSCTERKPSSKRSTSVR